MESAAVSFMQSYDVPALGIAVVHRGRLVYQDAFGFADTAAQERLTPKHRFRIASLSKPITSVAVLTLVEQGLLSLDDRPFDSRGMLRATFGIAKDIPFLDQITIDHLLTHTSGAWPNTVADPMFQRPELDHRELIAWTLRTQAPTRSPGETFAYSNFGYCLLGRIVEAVSKRPYEAFVQEAVLRRAGINDAEIAGNSLADRRSLEVHYYGQGGERPYGMNVRRMDAHGGWMASPASLALFAAHVDGLSLAQILQPKTIRSMTTPSAVNANYANGWQINRYDNWWHTGGMPGTASIMVRTHRGLCWAAFVNTRRRNSDLGGDLDRLVWRMIKQVGAWQA
jgi:CubicO group peptidase (beta-lactamase class C family)